MLRDKILVAVALGALASVALFVITNPPKLASQCDESPTIHRAWLKALELEKLTPGAIAVPTDIRVTYEPRLYPIVGMGVVRLCGRTQWYYAPDADLAGYNIKPEVMIYIAPGNCKMLHDTLVHEFLHVIHAYRNGGPPENDEAAVEAEFPSECK